MKKVLVHGCYHTHNFGDLLILDVVAQHIVKLGNLSTREVVCPWVADQQKDSVLPHAGKGLADCFFAGTAVFGGGGYFTNGDTLKNQLRFLRYTIPALIWRALGIPYAVIGVGAGPKISPFVRWQIRLLCHGANFVAVRDEESYQLLRECGVKKRQLMQTADWILALTQADIPQAALMQSQALLSADTRVGNLGAYQIAEGEENPCVSVGIHFSLPGGITHLLPDLLSVLKQYQRQQPQLRYVWLFDNSDDERVVIEKAFVGCGLRGQVLPKQDHWATAAIISRLDAVFTSKLHVGITAWALGVVPVSLSYHGKTKRFYRQVDLAECQADFTGDFSPLRHWLEQIASGQLQRRFESQHAKRASIKELAKTNARLLSGLLHRGDPVTCLL